MKIFQVVLLVAFGILALVSLYLFANFSGGGGASARAGQVVIWGLMPKAAIEAGLSELTASSNEYSEVSYVEMSAATFSRDLADAIAEGTGPDLVLISQEELYAERGKLAPIPYQTIPERTFVDLFVPEFELFLADEGVYGIPLALDPLVLYYNRTILASAGIASPPATWEAVAGLASVIIKRDQGGVLDQSLVPFGSYANVTNARAILSLLMLQAGTPITAKTDRGVQAVLDTEGGFGRTAAEAALTYYTEFGNPSRTLYSWNAGQPSSRSAFLVGDLALYPGFASELNLLKAASPNLDFDMGRIPRLGTNAGGVTYGKAYALAITRAARNPSGAYKVAAALSENRPALAIANTLGAAPAHRSLLTPSASDRYQTLYYPEALLAKGWLSPSPDATDAIFSAMIGNMLTGREEAAEAVEAAARALNASLR